MTKILAIASLLLLAALPVRADHSLAGARTLLTYCGADVTALRAMCIGYLAAIADGVARHQKLGAAKRTICVPQSVDLEAYRSSLLQYLATTPAAADGQSFEAIKAALEAEWPC